ncbi:hypothetical protein Hanom_Chr12g01108951 [Helianthus anomalus]
MQNTAHFAHPVNTVPVQYVQTTVPQIQYVQAHISQVQVQPATQQATQTSAPTETSQQSFFTQGFFYWSSLHEDLTEENFAPIANPDVSPDEFCFVALESIPEGQESEEVESRSEKVDEIAEAVVTADARLCADECDCAMMAATKVSPHILKDLCSDKCIIAFANIKEVNKNLRNKILKDEVQFEKTFKELKNKLFDKDNEISSLKHEHSITKDQLQTMVEKYQVCKKKSLNPPKSLVKNGWSLVKVMS